MGSASDLNVQRHGDGARMPLAAVRCMRRKGACRRGRSRCSCERTRGTRRGRARLGLRAVEHNGLLSPASRSCFIRASRNHRPVQTQRAGRRAAGEEASQMLCVLHAAMSAGDVLRVLCRGGVARRGSKARTGELASGQRTSCAACHVVRHNVLSPHPSDNVLARPATGERKPRRRRQGPLSRCAACAGAARGPHPRRPPQTLCLSSFALAWRLGIVGGTSQLERPHCMQVHIMACSQQHAPGRHERCGPAGRWTGPRRPTRTGRGAVKVRRRCARCRRGTAPAGR
jgi:hypothetical protein